ncbi:family 43 glycosylhydrolase [Cohnella fermenti]|uniref:Alpha-N-arabinofuranosidase n=1 Tax=Cohnella fermenti TaxID=2565925 RepID=A0A4S4BHH6_9BACL|nr:family 43 glycosylhydrolase [Cohnella fermenti]THF72929.1 alpha-N-arabinofuranosidase [Cohnella fermenti]
MKVVNVRTIEIRTNVGAAPILPAAAEVLLEGGAIATFPVEWERVDASAAEQPGSFEVRGKLLEDRYPNPLVPNRADPHVLKHTDGYYYFTGSVPEYDRLVLRRSRTVAGLSTAEEKVIWRKHERGEMGNHIWAPELHRIDGKWYIYFAAGAAEDKWAIRPYVLENANDDPLSGHWVEKGKIELPDESFSLDATTFELRGIRYLLWAQIIGDSSLYIARMDTPWSIAGEPVRISQPEHEWEIQGHRVNEGPAVLQRNGRVFVAYSASATDDRYCMGLLTASMDSDLLEPASWRKSPEPVFVSDPSSEQYGPGHNSFTVSEDGAAELIVYHARPYKELQGEALYDPNRHARVQRFVWLPDGTPFFGTPGWTLETGGRTAIARVTVEARDPAE